MLPAVGDHGVAPLAYGGDVLAHGIGGRSDLPIPLSFAVTGAAVTLVVSFALLALLWRTPRLDGPHAGRALPVGLARALDSRWRRWVLAAVGLVASAYVAVAAVFGPDDALNPTAGVVYVLVWVGLVPASALFGPVWRALNPLRTLHRGLAALTRVDPRRGLRALPAWLGYWPAAVGLFAFVWLELAAPDRATLPVLRAWFGMYAAVHLVAAAWFGSAWFDRGDAFEVYSGLVARMAPVGRRADGQLVWRNPLAGLDSVPAAPGLAPTVLVLLGSTAFDGLSNAPWWAGAAQTSPLPRVLVDTLGLLATIAAFGLAYAAATALAGRFGQVSAGELPHGPVRGLPAVFAHSLVPIAVGYATAHYYSLLVLEGQQTISNVSDTLGTGADLLGTGGRGVSAVLVPPTGVAVLSVVAVVVGHVVGVIAAHDRAVRLFPRRAAVAGQLPLLVLMVTYTVTGLLLLFAG